MYVIKIQICLSCLKNQERDSYNNIVLTAHISVLLDVGFHWNEILKSETVKTQNLLPRIVLVHSALEAAA